MIVAIGRARKDAKAIGHALKCRVISLGGIRKLDNLDFDRLRHSIPIFFFGRDESELAFEVEKEFSKISPIFNIVILNKKSVRNARLEEIRKRFEISKAEIRLGIKFDKIFQFSRKNEFRIEIHPDYDEYFVIGDEFVENLSRLGVEVREGNLILRKLYNIENVYVPELKAVISKRIGEKVNIELLSNVKAKEFRINDLIEKNYLFLKKLEEISIKFIENCDKVAVPFSGGKDSLASLILAKKALGDVTAIYIKTNYDMPETGEFVNRICDKLNVDLIVKEIEFDMKRYGMPRIENRWCTNLKIKALHEIIRKEGIKTVILGDRDAESRIRRLRAEITERDGIKEVFPIKYWSGAMVQLYILMNNLELHPLYYKGFYRLGCTICPSLSNWEKLLLEGLINKYQNFY